MANGKRELGIGVQIDAPTPQPEKLPYEGVMLPLNLPQPLTLEEKKYLVAVERGDLANVRRMLQRAHRRQHMNINCMDPLGRRALTLAIDGENLEMVELLVIMGVETKDALLQAINAEFVEAVELLLEHEELIHTEGEDYSWQKLDINTAMFTPDITPLVLAAHKNNYEILKILLDRGAALPVPHDIKCGCDDCIRHSSEDSLRHSLSRVNIYKALSSPSLIALTSNDPLFTAFQLSWELRSLAFAEQECKAEYLELRRQCQRFAVDLLDQTRSSQELAIILNYDPDSPPYEDGDHMHLARLLLAIQYKQKKFVAHPNIQQLLASIWYEGVPGFRRKTYFGKFTTIVRVAVLFPLYCLLYMIAPSCTTSKLMRKPFMKFLIHASSYLFFLFILILVSQRAEDNLIRIFGTESMQRMLDDRMRRQRGNGPTKLEMMVVLFVLGFIWEEIQEIYTQGIKPYLRNMWNFIDFTRNLLYVSVCCLRAFAYVQQRTEIKNDPNTAFIPREQWDDFDPQLIAEGLFAAANVFSALKLVHLFSIDPHLGPLQISLGRMVIDIVKFFSIYSLVLFAFACGLNQLLWYFADLEKGKCYGLPNGDADWEGNGDACMKWRRFGNLFESSQSLFWASFGMVGLENFELEGIKSYTRFWGLLMFGSYSVINVIVLLNLLIAMMSNSYAMIEEHSDTEWKFARTKLWLSYFEDSATLPPPFNILPSVKWITRLCRKSKKQLTRKATMKKETERENRYTGIMRALVWRYVAAMHRKCEESPVTEDDINEVKGEISTMRYEMLEIFGRNGMDVSSAAKKEKPVIAKRAKEWERRLMKDFHVAPIPLDADGPPDQIEELAPPPPNEDPKSKFKRIARQIANDSVAHKWNEVLKSVAKNSQIGRCHNRQSYTNQLNLQKAIEEAKRLVLQSPPPNSGSVSPIEIIDPTSSTLLDLIKEISEETEESTKAKAKPNKISARHVGFTASTKQSKPKADKPAASTSTPKPTKSTSDATKPKTVTASTSSAATILTPLPTTASTSTSATTSPDLMKRPLSPPKQFANPEPVQVKTILPSIKVTTPDSQIVLSPTTLISNKGPGKSGNKKPAPRAPSEEQNPTTSTSKSLQKTDSLSDIFDAPITFLSLNDSTEKLVPRAGSPDSDTSTLPPSSPRLLERIPDVTMVKRKAGWL